MGTVNLNEPGLRLQAQRRFDATATKQNYDTTYTSRPDAVPMWDDHSKEEQDDIMREWDTSGVLTEYAEVEWLGSESAVIESETNPWLQWPEGGPIDLTPYIGGPGPDCPDCGGLLSGVLNMDSVFGIQRCDTCEKYPGDLDAAKALRDTYFPTATIWFSGTN